MRSKVFASLLLCGIAGAPAGFGQTGRAPAAPAAKAPIQPPDRARSYFHYALGHLYAELASQYNNRGEYLNQAIDNFRQALQADPGAIVITEELSDLYIQAGRLNEAVVDSEAALRQNPNDLNARRILGRIYMRLVGDTQQGRVNEKMLRSAIEQYQKITEIDASDLDSWLILGRLQKVAQNSVDSEAAFKKALELDPENEDALTGLAMVYADLGDGRRASELLKKLAGKSPSLRTLTSLAAAYEQMRDYALAAETLRRASDFAPENVEIKRAAAQNYLLADQLDEALKLYQELVAADAKDVQSHLRISQIHRQQHRFDLARQANQRAKDLDPGNLEALYNDVNLFEAEGKIAEASKALKELLDSTAKRSYSASEKNNRALFLERLGILYRQQEQTAEAVNTFRELALLDENQTGPRAAAQIVDTYRQVRDFNKAIQEADAAYKKYPKDRLVLLTRASLLADSGKIDEAVAGIRALLDGKNDRETWLTLAQLYEKGKKYEEMGRALDEAEKLADTRDEKETIHFMRGAMFEKMRALDRSEAEFRKVLEINPKSASALNYLGYMLADRNVRLNEALDLIKLAVEQEPNNGAYLDSLGWVYFRLGQLEQAETYLLRALQSTAKDPTVNDHLGDVYFKQGRLKEAISQWDVSLKLWQAAPPSEADPEESAKVQKKLDGAKVRLARENSK